MLTCDWGLVGLHANVGITIDLQALRDLYDYQPISFRTVATNIDNTFGVPEPGQEQRIVYFRLFVDGEMRNQRLEFGRSAGNQIIETDILITDRFITIVTSDAGDYYHDQVVLVDPFFRLAIPHGI